MKPPPKSGKHEQSGSTFRRWSKATFSVLREFGWYNYVVATAATYIGIWLLAGTSSGPGLTVDRLGFAAFGIGESRTDLSHWILLGGDTPTIDLAPQPNGQVKGQIRIVVEAIAAHNPAGSYGFRLPLSAQITFRKDQPEQFISRGSAGKDALLNPKVQDAPWDCSKPYFPQNVGDHFGNVSFDGAWKFDCRDEALYAFFRVPSTPTNISATTKINGNAETVVGTPGLDFTIPSYSGISKTGRAGADFHVPI